MVNYECIVTLCTNMNSNGFVHELLAPNGWWDAMKVRSWFNEEEAKFLLCSNEIETIFHILWECKQAKQVWKAFRNEDFSIIIRK